MNSFFVIVSLMNLSGQRRDVIPGIRFSSNVEIIFHILGMFFEKCLRFYKECQMKNLKILYAQNS